MAEDQGQGPGTDQDADDQNVDDVEETDDDADKDDDSGDDKPENDGDVVTRAEFQKLFARMQAADRAKHAAEQKLKEREQADMTELDRTKAQLEEAKKLADEAQQALKKTVIENAFHRVNKFLWHDVADAVAALDLSGVEVAEDGKVTGMEAAIKDVAKRKPHYVKSKQEEGDGTPPAANDATNGRRKGDKSTNVDKNALLNRFPALGK